MAVDRPDLYNAYQQTQTAPVQAAMLKASYVASFVGHSAGKAFFVGLYRNAGHRPLSFRQYWEVPAHKELKKYDMIGYQGGRDPILWFELELLDFYAEWAGKLVVDWPGMDRSWWRWAERNTIQVRAILEEDLLNPEMPPWTQVSLTWQELGLLPGKWKEALRQWRGIYLIFDESDGKGYVGSACGRDNLLGRWTNYAASGHGGNKLLKARDPQTFRFSILERVSPDLPAEDVTALETTWKIRLNTREFGLNAN